MEVICMKNNKRLEDIATNKTEKNNMWHFF
jgi:hypothetical protein